MESHEVFIDKINEVYIRVDSEMSIAQEISDHFTFLVPGHTFIPAFRKRIWDGKIRLFNVMNRQLYYGLLPHLCKFLFLRDYKTKFKHDFKNDLVELVLVNAILQMSQGRGVQAEGVYGRKRSTSKASDFLEGTPVTQAHQTHDRVAKRFDLQRM